MAKISRWRLSSIQEKEVYELLQKSLAKLGSVLEVNAFLEDLLTPTEKTMLGKRLFIAILLIKGFTYEAIIDAIHVSPPTIHNVNFSLKHGHAGYQKVINNIIREEKVEAFLDKISASLLSAFPKKYGSAVFLAKQKEGKEIYTRRRNRLFIK